MPGLDSVDKNMPILVVDDYSTMRRVLKKCLYQLGFKNVTEAENGPDALQKLSDSEFKFIISDSHMPSMQGIDLLRAIRSDDRLRDVPFLMITPSNLKEQIMERASDAGHSTCIAKPFTATALEQKMESILCAEEKAPR